MKEQVLSIAAYIESLEQRIAALETRCDELETRLAEQQVCEVHESEPEIEVELILSDEDTSSTQPESSELSDLSDQSDQSDQSDLSDSSDLSDPSDPSDLSDNQPDPSEPSDSSDSSDEQAPAPAPSPAPAPDPAPKPAPQQTSLFGTPVSDIRKAISIGDRFLFQRELFGQNGELMQKTLDALNNLSSFEDAITYIHKHFDWDQNSGSYELFVTVLKRRFS